MVSINVGRVLALVIRRENRGGNAMLISLWRRMRKCDPTSYQGNHRPKGRCLSFRPQIDALEDRMLPAPLTYGVLQLTPAGSISAAVAPALPQPRGIAASGALSGLQPIGC